MIKAIIFDLDSILVQAEALKAFSYARAAVEELSPGAIRETEVIGAYREVTGLSCQQVAQGLLKRFALEKQSGQRIKEFNVSETWEAFIQVRMRIYESLLAAPRLFCF